MDQRIYHGSFTPSDLASELVAHFHRGNLRVQQMGTVEQLTLQIATHRPTSGGQTALTVTLIKVPDGVSVKVGQQQILGVAASIGITALSALRNPFALLGRLDDLAQDIEHLQMTDEVWRVLDGKARSLGTGLELSERLRRLTCLYCGSANEIGVSNCIACGAPLGAAHPGSCKHCGFVIKAGEVFCPNCNCRLS